MLSLILIILLRVSAVFGYITAATPTCPVDFTILNNYTCVKLFDTPRLYQDALDHCKSFNGGHMVAVHNAIDNRNLVKIANTYYNYTQKVWIGMVCDTCRYDLCAWEDKSGYGGDYNNFLSGEQKVRSAIFQVPITANPNCNIGINNFMELSGSGAGRWASGNGSSLALAYYCEILTYPPGFCKNQYNGYCYEFHMDLLNETEARKVCQQGCGGDLASVHSDEENTYLYNAHPYDGTLRQYRIGARATEDGTGRYWVDGTNFNYSNYGFFNQMDGLCTTVSLDQDVVLKQEWMSNPCDVLLPFACKRPRNATSCESVDPTAVPNIDPVPTGNLVPTNPPTSELMCFETMYFTGNGTIFSPFYPNSFNPILYLPSCKYILTVEPGTIAQIQFSTETNVKTSRFDFYSEVEVGVYDEPFASFRGNPPFYSLNSTTNMIRMEFTVMCDSVKRCRGEKWMATFGSALN